MITTYIGQTVYIGDEVCFIKNFRTGSSTIRKCKCCGEIININKSKITIHCTKSEIDESIGEDIVVPVQDIICKINV